MRRARVSVTRAATPRGSASHGTSTGVRSCPPASLTPTRRGANNDGDLLGSGKDGPARQANRRLPPRQQRNRPHTAQGVRPTLAFPRGCCTKPSAKTRAALAVTVAEGPGSVPLHDFFTSQLRVCNSETKGAREATYYGGPSGDSGHPMCQRAEDQAG